MQHITEHAVHQAIYFIDPMNTGCVENCMEDEYCSETKEIVAAVQAGNSLNESVLNTFNANFWEGCLTPDTLKLICQNITEISQLS